jgi:long-chain fatty acid transport protein
MRNSILASAAALALVNSGNALAGGLWLNEFGDLAGGRAAAGASAGVDEAITIAYNPASATALRGDQIFVSGGAYIPDNHFDVKYSTPRLGFGDGGDAGVVTPTGSAAYVHRFDNSKWSAGFYFAGLAGAGLEYDKTWAGRYQATDVALQIVTFAPTLAYQLTDRLSLGASVQAYYAKLNVKLAVPHPEPARQDAHASINGNDTKAAFTLGAVYALTERTRFGIAYQSELEPEFGGDLKIKQKDEQEVPVAEFQTAVDTKLNMAQYVRASMSHDLDAQWTVNFTIGWDDWSQLSNVFIATEGGSAGLAAKWHDTYHYAWGAEYRVDPFWTLTSGVSYDTNPVDSKNRNAQLPVDRQLRLAFGARYNMGENLTIGGYLNYADLGNGKIDAANFGGEYKNNAAPQVVANLNWRF